LYVRLCLVALFLAACGEPARLAPLAPDAVIVAFGDSLTHGNGAGADEAYPAVLEKLVGRRVINAGVPGETTAQGLERLPAVLEEHRPALVLLTEGGNDMLRQTPHADIRRNLEAMLAAIRASGAQALLVATPQPKLLGGAPSFYEELAQARNVPVEMEIWNDVLKNPRLKSDPIHANAAGYRQVAERIAELLREAGAL
jgi:lysophospholipase L1-like esterase